MLRAFTIIKLFGFRAWVGIQARELQTLARNRSYMNSPKPITITTEANPWHQLYSRLEETTTYLKELHAPEVAANHYGDDPKSCTYCVKIAAADEVLERLRVPLGTIEGKCPPEVECQKCGDIWSPEITESLKCPTCNHPFSIEDKTQ